MSRMPRLHELSTCPSCAEPLESDDKFCGVCGADLTSAPQVPPTGDRPTLVLNGSAPRVPPLQPPRAGARNAVAPAAA
ncbi:zinc ribbon domain-containing protein, partial [Streptomyces sp. URMC 123]|uniref:zinc ribbon domain-containing protein n=1 Tax=Streptomyces sp. URMC 123 TaxID=3423403 RepID=UPI003F1A52AD